MKIREINDTKIKKIGAMLRLTGLLAALVMIVGFATPLLRKSSVLGAVGERALAEMAPFSAAVGYYSGGELARLTQKPSANDAGYRAVAQLLSQVAIQQNYEGLFLVYRDETRMMHYLEDGAVFSLTTYKPLKAIIDRIYTGKSVGDYARDLVVREDGRVVAPVCLPVYGSGRTVLAVLVAECNPGDTGYHLLGPVNLYYVGGGGAVVMLLCALLLYLGRRSRAAKADQPQPGQEQNGAAHTQEPDSAVYTQEPDLPEDDFQLPFDSTGQQPPVETQEGTESDLSDRR